MDKKRKNPAGGVKSFGARLQRYPQELVKALLGLSAPCGGQLYLAGGTVRDWLLGRPAGDLDFVVRSGAEACCRLLQSALGGGTLVPLSGKGDDAARLVWKGLTLDVSGFRGGAQGLEDDLRLRDFTVNAMAVSLADLMDEAGGGSLIDPTGGLADLQTGRLQVCDRAFVDDPLRMLRGYRLRAVLGLAFSDATQGAILACSHLIAEVAAERINHELDLIIASDQAYGAFEGMAESGILWHIIPELRPGLGVQQPGFHHLDVFHHCLAALEGMEEVLQQPGRFFPGREETLSGYIAAPGMRKKLKWSALLHDMGKPLVKGEHPQQKGRVTFYNHDRIGRDLLLEVARRLKWSKEVSGTVGSLIELHMHPFHLCNVRRTAALSARACLKIWKKAGDDLPGLFLLAMADSLSCRGKLKPAGMEEDLAALFEELQQTIDRVVRPALSGPRLITGKDLKERFNLSPGPVFATILTGLELAMVEGHVHDREEAIEWVRRYLRQEGTGGERL
ncbi:MAG: HD domain-containing protein [Desulfocapsaceae bacterium]|nr:HD domain-containing protein [Desulfocapsaceae bacterium]